MEIKIKNEKYAELAKLFACMGNATLINLLETLACKGTCVKGDFIELKGLSRFTVGTNLKYLKKYGLVNGSLSAKSLSYCVNYEKLAEFKHLFDDFYTKIMETRHKEMLTKESCNS